MAAARAEAKAEGFLRGACAVLAAAAALLVGFSTQTEMVLLIRKKATVKDVEALWVLAVASGAAAGYHLLQLFKCFYLSRFAENPCRNCRVMAWTCLLLDKVLEMVALLSMPDFCRGDLANLLKDVQAHEKEKLNLTARIQVLKKAGRPSERLVNHEDCRSMNMAQHVCVHLKEITEAAGTEDAEADAEYDGALKEAIQGVQEAVTNINDHMEEVRYEIDALEAEMVGSNLTEVEEAFPDTLLIK